MTLHDKETISRLADHVGMSRSKASGLLRGVGMRKDRQGRYLTEKALAVLTASVDPARSAGRVIAGRNGTADTPPIALSNYADARAEGERMRAEKIRLELEIKKGNLVDRQNVIDAGQDVLAHIRVGLTGLLRIAPRLLDKDAATISRILTEEIENTLRDLADVDAFTVKTLGI